MDATITCDYPFIGEVHKLIVRITFNFLAMDHDLTPPFVASEVLIDPRCVPKTQDENPEEVDYSQYFKDGHVRTSLKLNGVLLFSIKCTVKSIAEQM